MSNEEVLIPQEDGQNLTKELEAASEVLLNSNTDNCANEDKSNDLNTISNASEEDPENDKNNEIEKQEQNNPSDDNQTNEESNKQDLSCENDDAINYDNESDQMFGSNVFQLTENTKTSQPSQPPKKSEEEIESLCRQLLDGSIEVSSIDIDDTLPVVVWLTCYRNDKMSEHDVDSSEKSDRLISSMLRQYRATVSQMHIERQTEAMNNKLARAEKKLKQAEAESKRAMSELRTSNNVNMRHLQDKQAHEQDELLEKFNSPPIQRQYSQASGHLRLLRMQTQLLQQSNRFSELRVAQQSLTEEEKKETESVSHHMSEQLRNQMKLLDEKHNEEKQCRQIAFEDKETRTRILCGRKTDAIKRHIANINADLNALQNKTKENSQVVMQSCELMMKVTRAVRRSQKMKRAASDAPQKSRLVQPVKTFEEEEEGNEFKCEKKANIKARALEVPNIFSLKLPPLTKSKSTKEKREKLMSGYKV